MKKFFFIFLFTLPIGFKCFAQSNIEFEGYFQNFPVVQFLPNNLSSLYNTEQRLELDISRLRLKPVFYISGNTRINLETETDIFVFNKLTDIFGLNAEKTNRQIVKLKWLSKSKNIYLLNFIDRFYLRCDFDWGNITIGRQRISWGTGRIWNPTDLFNPISPTAFYKKEKEGADAISGKISLGNFTDLNLVFNPSEKLSSSNYGLRFRTNLFEYDVSIMAGRFDGTNVIGADFAGNLSQAGIRGEGIYFAGNKYRKKGFVKYILGIDYQFTPKFYALVEFHFNGEGEKKKENYPAEFSRLIKGEILNLGRSYLAIGSTYNASPLLNLTFTNINNLIDGSSVWSLQADYSLTENSYFDFGFQYMLGEKYSEYWYFPVSLYLLYEYYF